MPVISTNNAANTAVRYLNINSQQQSDSLAKLASGSRITKASDDAAGLAISTRLSSDVATLSQAATNASHAVSVLQTADGGASNISDILQRMKALATEANSGTVNVSDLASIDAEFQQLIDQIDSISKATRYNGTSLLDGTSAYTTGVSVMVGSKATDSITMTIAALTSTSLGVNALDVTSAANAQTALTALDTAINTVSDSRAVIGALESRFAFSAESVVTTAENLTAANSAITDVDVAAEQAKLSSASVKVQAAVAAAAQANQMPQYLLNLLK
jgi:flagellin